MKKVILSAYIIAFTVITGFSQMRQGAAFAKDNNVINIGVGAGDQDYLKGYNTILPPISASYERCVVDRILSGSSIGLGGYVGYSSHGWVDNAGNQTYHWHVNDLVIACRGALHFQFVNKLDTYLGALVGYDVQTNNYNEKTDAAKHDLKGSGTITGGFVGTRYYFTNYFAVNVELSSTFTFLTLGVAFKI